jgi:hypothetical protein
LDDYEFNQGVVARGQHYLVVGSASSDGGGDKSTAAQERELALKKLLAPLLLVADASYDDLSLDNVQTNFNFYVTMLSSFKSIFSIVNYIFSLRVSKQPFLTTFIS